MFPSLVDLQAALWDEDVPWIRVLAAYSFLCVTRGRDNQEIEMASR